MNRVSSLTSSITDKISSSTTSVVAILTAILGAVWTVTTDGSGWHYFKNLEGRILCVLETSDRCIVHGLPAEFEVGEFPPFGSSDFYWFKTNGEWDVFWDNSFFYLSMGADLYFFGSCDMNHCVVCGKRLNTKKVFYTTANQVTEVGYSNSSSFSLQNTAEVTFLPEYKPLVSPWQHPDGTIVVSPISVYDAAKKSFMGYLPGIWAMQPDFPSETVLNTGSGKNLTVLHREDLYVGIES